MANAKQTAENAPVAPQGGETTQQAISAHVGAGNAYVETLENAVMDAEESGVLFNCCTNQEIPDWNLFDAIEIGGCRNDADEGANDTCICGGYMAEEAQFFTVYGHLIEGGVEAITDVPTLEKAKSIAAIFANQNGFEIHVNC
ncbi:hypothetical protein [Agrobacterium vitis]|uniref:hypothetical protein n=1 Tax=Agrobacterium vitis TaxID=373 RepID=UPI0012E9E2A5|nr:hypothetical protein [Agrobacterium vitis]MUO72871.1 hypothetical protein [Agrobacterium vitis]